MTTALSTMFRRIGLATGAGLIAISASTFVTPVTMAAAPGTNAGQVPADQLPLNKDQKKASGNGQSQNGQSQNGQSQNGKPQNLQGQSQLPPLKPATNGQAQYQPQGGQQNGKPVYQNNGQPQRQPQNGQQWGQQNGQSTHQNGQPQNGQQWGQQNGQSTHQNNGQPQTGNPRTGSSGASRMASLIHKIRTTTGRPISLAINRPSGSSTSRVSTRAPTKSMVTPGTAITGSTTCSRAAGTIGAGSMGRPCRWHSGAANTGSTATRILD